MQLDYEVLGFTDRSLIKRLGNYHKFKYTDPVNDSSKEAVTS